jgi:hypothetical protein
MINVKKKCLQIDNCNKMQNMPTPVGNYSYENSTIVY